MLFLSRLQVYECILYENVEIESMLSHIKLQYILLHAIFKNIITNYFMSDRELSVNLLALVRGQIRK